MRRLLALAAVLTLLTVGSVSAHDSSYCGHGLSGFATKTVYFDGHKHYYSDAGGSIVGWEHHHEYAHGPNNIPPWDHTVNHKKCSKH